MLQRRVRGAVPAVAGGEREEGGQAPEDRPLVEGDRRSWYAHQLPFAGSSRLGPSPPPFFSKSVVVALLVFINAALLCSSSRRGRVFSFCSCRNLRHCVFLVKLLCRPRRIYCAACRFGSFLEIFEVQSATVRSLGTIMSE